jgi:hypothetical protein
MSLCWFDRPARAGVEEIDIPVRDLDDGTMMKIMAHENQSEWGHTAIVDQETIRVRAVVIALGEGRMHRTRFREGVNLGPEISRQQAVSARQRGRPVERGADAEGPAGHRLVSTDTRVIAGHAIRMAAAPALRATIFGSRSLDVRCQGESGSDLLDLSFSAHDPLRPSAAPFLL